MPLRIANWNLDRARVPLRRDSIREQVAAVQAHIWVLTESRDAMDPGTGYRRVAESLAHARGDNDERWVSIWTNLSGATWRQTSDEEYAACAIIDISPAARLAVYGTVLPWRGSVWLDRPSAKACAYGAALSVQAQDWSELRRQSDLVGVCVAGDFNQDLSDTHYYWSDAARELLRRALDANELCATTSDPTDPVRKMSEGREACIDHICISRSLVGRQTGGAHAWSPVVKGRALTDHPGVWIELDV